MHVRVGIAKGDLQGDTNAAIQQAIDAAGAYGGGTVELLPGVYTLYDSVQLRRNVRLIGSGEDTVLRKCDGARSTFAVDADYGQKKVTVQDPAGFQVGMGVVVTDDRAGGWIDTVTTITLIQDNVLFVNGEFLMDYDGDRGGVVYNAFPLIAGIDVDSVSIEGLTVDGNREANWDINGCVGGGIYLHRARKCRIADCTVRDFAGDGISFQTTQDIEVSRCRVLRASGLGFHPGTGSVRPVIRDCQSIGNGLDGVFLCWRAQEGRFERNECLDNGRHGISIGHKDTDNLFQGNVLRGNASHGVYFRDEKTTNAGSRNTFLENTIEDNGGSGVCIDGHTVDLTFEGNVIRDTRSGERRTQRVGIEAGKNSACIRAKGNRLENHLEADVRGEVSVED
ncbi:MAG: right-handed parallel beta-helix repeat-containing protein [Armatimonadetes bacterium]|nr:right-handed parallel beta-helix repeat-containing protein [Armatimonadota bacterium]